MKDNYRKCLIKVGDEVCVINGDHKKLKSKIIEFDREEGYVRLAGLLFGNKFLKEKNNKNHKKIHISNVALVENGKVVRAGRKEGVRVSKRSGNAI